MDAPLVVLTAALALLASGVAASAGCVPLPAEGTADLPGRLSVSCAHGSCAAAVAGVHVADVGVAGAALVCDSTRLRVEDAIPPACDAALRRTGASIRQDEAGRAGASEVVIDVLEPAQGLPWVGSRRPLRACLPHYSEKRGDVWQHAWRGEGPDLLFQVFEEDESEAGRGNSRRGARSPKPLVTTSAPTWPPPAPAVRPSPGARRGGAAPDDDRF